MGNLYVHTDTAFTYIIHICKGLREFALMYEETELNVHLYIPIYKKKLCIYYTNLTAAYIITIFAFLRLLMMS